MSRVAAQSKSGSNGRTSIWSKHRQTRLEKESAFDRKEEDEDEEEGRRKVFGCEERIKNKEPQVQVKVRVEE